MSYKDIPQELKDLPQWVVWGIDPDKPKMPFKPTTLKAAKAGDPTTWSGYHEAVNCVKSGRAKGIGFEFHDGGIYGVDLDHVLHDGKLTDETARIVNKLDSYTEISPSGDGLHILLKANGVQPPSNKKKLPTEGALIECYNAGRYFTVTGNVWGECKPLQTRTDALQAVVDEFLTKEQHTPAAPVEAAPQGQANTPDRDHYLIGLRKDDALKAYYNGDRPQKDESADDQGFMNKLAYWCNKNAGLMRQEFENSPHYATKKPEHKTKWQREDYSGNTIAKAIADTPTTAREKDERFQADKPNPLGHQGAIPKRTNDGYTVEGAGVESRQAVLKKASEIPYEPPRWLIKPYFQRGKGTLLQADNGTGKTAVSCSFAAHVSTGRPILDIQIDTPGDVIFLSTEDDLPVLRGRCEADGGNLDKIHFMTNAAYMTFNSPAIEEAIQRVNAKYIVFDPFQVFLGANVDMNMANQTRPELAKLFDMADRNDCSVCIVAHMGKGSSVHTAVNRSLGSVDIPAAMRSIIQLTRNPDNDNELVAVHVKCSNAPKGKSLKFTIGDRGRVDWTGYSDMTPDDLLVIKKREEKGVPYENEPLVQVFNQLLTERPGGGFWPYAELNRCGMQILGFPPFGDISDLKRKLKGELARELITNAGLVVACGVKSHGERGVRIERYEAPRGYQIPLPTE